MDTGEIIKKQQEKKAIDEGIEIGKQEMGKIVDQITGHRRELEQLRKDKEKFLELQEAEARERVRQEVKKLRQIEQEMASLEAEAVKTIDDTTLAFSRATDEVGRLVSGANEAIKAVDGIKLRYEGLLEHLKEVGKKLDEKVLKNSEWEKGLKELKEKVDQRSEEADQKLKEAKDLAFWHREPNSVYTDK